MPKWRWISPQNWTVLDSWNFLQAPSPTKSVLFCRSPQVQCIPVPSHANSGDDRKWHAAPCCTPDPRRPWKLAIGTLVCPKSVHGTSTVGLQQFQWILAVRSSVIISCHYSAFIAICALFEPYSIWLISSFQVGTDFPDMWEMNNIAREMPMRPIMPFASKQRNSGTYSYIKKTPRYIWVTWDDQALGIPAHQIHQEFCWHLDGLELCEAGKPRAWIENSWAVCHLCNAQITLWTQARGHEGLGCACLDLRQTPRVRPMAGP